MRVENGEVILNEHDVKFANGGREPLAAVAWLRENFPLGAYVREADDEEEPGRIGIVVDHELDDAGIAALVADCGDGEQATWTTAGVDLHGVEVVTMRVN